MQWQNVTAIYTIGEQYPIATFVNEAEAEAWAESKFPGDWIKKPVKIPHLPLASKTAKKNLKNVAAMLDNLEWDDEDGGESEPVKKVIITPDN